MASRIVRLSGTLATLLLLVGATPWQTLKAQVAVPAWAQTIAPGLNEATAILSVKPYVEEHCVPTRLDLWPFEAQECTYRAGNQDLRVTVANPDARRVALWILDSIEEVEYFRRWKATASKTYVDGIREIARYVLGQSSRIFPLRGQIFEHMPGGSPTVYLFEKGVTAGRLESQGRRTVRGLYCRINSLTREDYCFYRASQGPVGSASECLAQVSTAEARQNRCLAMHAAAWSAERHEGFRAKTKKMDEFLRRQHPETMASKPDEVLRSVRDFLECRDPKRC